MIKTTNPMTALDDTTISMVSTNARRIAQLQADREAFANPIMPSTIKVTPPELRRFRRSSVKHRAIR